MEEYLEGKKQLLKRLDTDPESGLNSQQVTAHRAKYGENVFTREKQAGLLKRIWASAREPMILMLVLAGIIALAVNTILAATGGEADFLECAGIFAAISLSVIITVVMEGKSAKAFEALSKINQDTQVKVIRGGKVSLIPQKEIVVGDILCVETGDKLAADGRLLESNALQADESSLTGESLPVKKNANADLEGRKLPVAERVNMLYSGCFITGGNAKAVVTHVGDHTEFGKIAKELSAADDSTTPLQEKLAKLGKLITLLGAAAAAVVFIVQLILLFSNGTASLATVSEAFITSIVLIVAAVPEGLPTIVAVSLAINIIKMSKQNSLVKKMIACETVGCINVVCSDKTGTLTENKMTVIDIYTDGKIVCPEELSNKFLLENFSLNSTADLSDENGSTAFIGNPTESALLSAVQKSGIKYHHYRQEIPLLHVFPFSSETKNMTSVVSSDGRTVVYTKGSPEKILAMCSVCPDKEEIERKIQLYQEDACRILAFAHKDVLPAEDWESMRSDLEQDLVFDGFAVITDPLRSDVYEAALKCKDAGIELKMLTGDNIITAKAIAMELGLLDQTHTAVEAREVEDLSEKELQKRLPRIAVIARSTPTIKMRVVNALKKDGNIVAVTGDGINDAPAIKNADVGIAMGIAGTEVSKEASDIVLLDDSFSTIVKAVQWGRGIYENFQRFIQFQLTVNLSSVIVVLFSILAGFKTPFTALQLLWINIIMDGPPALTLGLEPIRSDLMKNQPTRRDSHIVSGRMLIRIAVNGVFISAVFLSQQAFNFLGIPAEQMPTALFTLFVVFQLFNAFNSRELGSSSILKNMVNNKLMLGTFGLTFALQVIITQFGGAFFGTVPLSLVVWVKIILAALSVIAVSELHKLITRSFQKEPVFIKHQTADIK